MINRVPEMPFAQIANSALRDKRLSYTARGILAYVLSHSGEWKIDRNTLGENTSKEGQKAIQNALNELTALGYRTVVKEQQANGQWTSVVVWVHAPELVGTGGDYADRSVSRRMVPVTANKNTMKNTVKNSGSSDDEPLLCCGYCKESYRDRKRHSRECWALR